MKRVLSGIQPSGTLHIGNYFGMMKRMVEYQKSSDLFAFIVNYHALTTVQDAKLLHSNTLEALIDFVALGLDPDKCTFWVQSDIPEVQELAWILSCVTPMGLLERCHSFKDKTAKGITPTHGLFAYPVLMAADILLYRADAVPVGEDQKQHVELTRDLAERFNNAFGKTFVVPEPVIPSDAARIMGLDDPTKKMSKSAGSEYNYIALMDPPDAIRRKIRRAVTDSGAEVRPGDDKPALTNLLTIYSALSGEPVETIVGRYAGKGYADFKSDLGEVVVEALAPFQSRMRELEADPGFTLDVLKTGAERAEAIASRTLAKVRERLGLVPRPS